MTLEDEEQGTSGPCREQEEFSPYARLVSDWRHWREGGGSWEGGQPGARHRKGPSSTGTGEEGQTTLHFVLVYKDLVLDGIY